MNYEQCEGGRAEDVKRALAVGDGLENDDPFAKIEIEEGGQMGGSIDSDLRFLLV